MSTIKQDNLIIFFIEEADKINNFLDDDQLADAINNIKDETKTGKETLENMEYAITSIAYRGGADIKLLRKYQQEYQETFK